MVDRDSLDRQILQNSKRLKHVSGNEEEKHESNNEESNLLDLEEVKVSLHEIPKVEETKETVPSTQDTLYSLG